MAEPSARSERITDMLTGHVGRGVKQFFGTTGLSYLISLTGIQWLGVFGAPAFFLVDHVIEKRIQRGRYRTFKEHYGAEISALSGVPLPDLTIEKTQEILEANRKDPRFAIFNESMTAFEHLDRQRDWLSRGVNLATVIAVSALSLSFVSPLAISFLVGTATTLVLGIGNDLNKMNAQDMFSRTVGVVVGEIQQQVAVHPVEPSKVMQVFLKAQPKLQAEVARQFGKAYESMSLGEKNQVVALYDEALQVTPLTHKVNSGVMRPTELAWIAFGQRSGVAEKKALPIADSRDAMQQVQEQGRPRADFVSRLQAEKLEQKAAAPTLH